MKNTVQPTDIITLIDQNKKTFLLSPQAPTDKYKGIGVINPHDLIGQSYGNQITLGTKTYWVLPASLLDKMTALKRKAQIILPKDAAHIIINCSIEPGHTILEAGIGSGSLTIALASIVGSQGTIISYDTRQDFIEHALKNIQQAGLTDRVIAKNQDVTQSIDEQELNAVILDIPNPWDAIGHVWPALTTGGYICAYTPLVSQMEQTVHTLTDYPFISIYSLETIQRNMVVGIHGTRPDFHMLGHTGYLTFARKVLEKPIETKNIL
ncbi:MAG: tRNA (adenine-N1)-methyltransferase [Candidatus Thermoplasmatota archaeon]|nr:tRNA (adenine-N1)-methyltransferase [Candidatus Thermoplasmatota archaeon]MBU1941694.1 tRNA (adenine-N1)-methyltransferase [Candidatus Thermoplasmatota archaeon]